MTEKLLEVQALSQFFGDLQVLDNLTFNLEPGEIIGLVGRRGSGKSTLLETIWGANHINQGRILINGMQISFSSTAQAHANGVELITQVPQLVEQLNIVENIFLGREIYKSLFFRLPDNNRMYQQVKELLTDIDIPYNILKEPIANLTDEQRHLVAIARAFSHPPALLLVDDVLPNLSFHNQKIILTNIKNLSQKGLGAIIISDDFKHLFRITDRILVLYQGKLAADLRTKDCSPRDIVELMVGSRNRERVTPIIWALESYHSAKKQTDALFQRQAVLHENLEASDTLNRQLIKKLSEQVKVLDNLNTALQETQRRLLTEREEERKALARELHDLVIQDLLSINYRLEEIEDNEKLKKQRKELRQIRDTIRKAVGDLRQHCRDLRPPTIDNHGLSSAIRSHVQEWGERNNITVKIDIDPNLGRLPETTEISIFRIIQEGVNNISKHATAQNVSLTLRQTAANNLLVSISDDGKGFDIPPNLADLSEEKHFGLIGISERAALLSGSMNIKSSPTGGFVLEVEIPSPHPSM